MRQLLLYLHIGSAALLVGEILYSTLWLRSSMTRGSGPEAARHVLAAMAFSTQAIAIPAFYVNMTSGILLGFVGHWRWLRATWLIASIILYTIMASMWQGTLIPLRRKLTADVERGGVDGAVARALSEGFESAARKLWRTSAVVLTLFALILGLMIWKPTI